MKLVLCEGNDDVSVIKGLCEASAIAGLRVERMSGRDSLRAWLSEARKRPEFVRNEVESLGILLDADDIAEASWKKLTDDVKATFEIVLMKIGEFVGSQPRIAGFLVAGSDGKGMLEDLCLESVSSYPGFPCLKAYEQCLVEAGIKRLHSKGRFRAWMATQSDYELHVGKAAEAGYLPFDSPAFDRLREFLKSM